MLCCSLYKSWHTVGQLLTVNHPVAERRVVGLAWILVAKPSVVHNEQFAAHRGNVAHHLVHALLVDVEIHTFPAVEQNVAQLVAMGKHILASPLVEVA